jgi:hypothetical protein
MPILAEQGNRVIGLCRNKLVDTVISSGIRSFPIQNSIIVTLETAALQANCFDGGIALSVCVAEDI